MGSYWIRVGPNSMLGILIRRVKLGHKGTQVGCHVMTEAGIDVYTNTDVWGKENFSGCSLVCSWV